MKVISAKRASESCSDNPKSAIQNQKWMGILAIVLTIVFGGIEAGAQQPGKVYRVGYLSPLNRTTESPRFQAIRQALRELGYLEGKNIAFEYRYAEGKGNRYPELAAELVRRKVDILVVVGGGRLIVAAKNATETISIVMAVAVIDPVKEGVIDSLARPGGNVTGLTNLEVELGGKQLELFKQAVPNLVRVAVLYEPALRFIRSDVKEVLPVAARALGLTIEPWEVQAADGFEDVFAALNKRRPDGLYVRGSAGPLVIANQKRIVDFTAKERVTVDVRHQRTCRGRRPDVLRGGPRGQLPARRILRGQNSEGSQASRLTGGTADQVRAGHQSQDGEANQRDDSAVLVVPSRSGD